MRKYIIIFVLIVTIFLFFFYQNKHIVISEYNYDSVKIPASFDGFKIVLLSDIHNAEFGKNNSVLIDKVMEQKPDIITITGDLVDSDRTNIDKTLSLAKELVKICPVYYVTGNHEYWLDANNFDKLITGLKSAGVNVMVNDVIYLSSLEDEIAIIGADDCNLFDDTVKMLSTQIDESKDNELKNCFKLLLAHEPQYLYKYSSADVDLVLSGHAHGGQFRFPYIGGIVAPDQGLFPKYSSGEYFENSTTMIVSRGIGNSVIPVRLFNYPDIVVVNLQSLKTEE